MSAKDLIKNSVLEGFQLNGDISLVTVLVTVLLSFAMGLFVYFIYKRTFTGVVFTKSFGISLILLSMVTGVVIMTISSNLMLSLGMVGALSIVRFRTAVKDPMDTVYMFWAIAEGIIIGARLYLVAILVGIGIGIVMVLLGMFRFRKNKPYIMVLRFDEEAKQDVQNLLRKFPQGKLKSKTVTQNTIELTIEMNVEDQDIMLMDRFASIPGVYDASLISYTGDVVS